MILMIIIINSDDNYSLIKEPAGQKQNSEVIMIMMS